MRDMARDCHEAGVRLLQYATELKQRKWQLSDNEAFRLAMLAHPDLAEEYTGREIRRDGAAEVRKVFTDQYARPQNLTPVEKLVEIVNSMPKLFNQGRDWPAIIQGLHEHLDIVRDAAAETFKKLVDDMVCKNAGNQVRSDRAQCQREIRARYSDLANTLDNARNINERALQLILSQRV